MTSIDLSCTEILPETFDMWKEFAEESDKYFETNFENNFCNHVYYSDDFMNFCEFHEHDFFFKIDNTHTIQTKNDKTKNDKTKNYKIKIKSTIHKSKKNKKN